MSKLIYTAAIAAASMFASSAQAAQFLTISGPSGNFGDDSVTCAAAGPCSFSRTFSFTTPTGFNLASLDISSIATSNPLTNIDFTSVTFNGVSFNTLATGTQEFRNLLNQALLVGGTNTLSVAGTTGGDASFTGNIAFAANSAVPEPATWGMMMLGFGGMGYAMRRRRAAGARIRFA